MKKIVIITALFLSLASLVNAQDDPRELFHIGVKAGLSYSNVYDSQGDGFNSDAKVGFTGGAFLRIPLGTYIGVQPEVLVTQKGFKGNGRLLGSPYSFKRTTTFIDVPILLAIKPIPLITLLVGPQFSYLISDKYEFTSAVVNYDQEKEFKNENIRKNILGIVGGVDVNLQNIVLSARLGWDIQNNNGNGTSDTPRYKNVCTQICVGFKF